MPTRDGMATLIRTLKKLTIIYILVLKVSLGKILETLEFLPIKIRMGNGIKPRRTERNNLPEGFQLKAGQAEKLFDSRGLDLFSMPGSVLRSHTNYGLTTGPRVWYHIMNPLRMLNVLDMP